MDDFSVRCAAAIVIIMVIYTAHYLFSMLTSRTEKKVSDPERQKPVTVWNHDAMDMKQDFLHKFSVKVAKKAVDIAETEQKDKVRKEIDINHLKIAIEQILKEELEKIDQNKSS